MKWTKEDICNATYAISGSASPECSLIFFIVCMEDDSSTWWVHMEKWQICCWKGRKLLRRTLLGMGETFCFLKYNYDLRQFSPPKKVYRQRVFVIYMTAIWVSIYNFHKSFWLHLELLPLIMMSFSCSLRIHYQFPLIVITILLKLSLVFLHSLNSGEGFWFLFM